MAIKKSTRDLVCGAASFFTVLGVVADIGSPYPSLKGGFINDNKNLCADAVKVTKSFTGNVNKRGAQ